MNEISGVPPKSISKILVPCDRVVGIDRVYQSALSVAQETSAGLVLLCVHDQPKEAINVPVAQGRYSKMRGLQAKLQSCPVPCKIESAFGSMADCVLTYAYEHDVDLIVMSEAEVQEADKVCSEPFVQRVHEMVHCDTLIVEKI